MSDDLISNAFVDNLNRAIVKRNVTLAKIALFLSAMYSILHLFAWYLILTKTDWELVEGTKMIFIYIISPGIDVIIFSISIYGYSLILKAYRYINSSCDRSDPALMSKGFACFYKANILSIILISISIITTIINQFL